MAYRYIGNKSKLVPDILDRIREIVPPGATIADPMCGTASVSVALRESGYHVVAADLMTYAVHHARVRLRLDRAPRFRRLGDMSYRDVHAELSQLNPVKGFFLREFSPDGTPSGDHDPRAYFTSDNAARIDAMRQRIREWNESELLTTRENSLLLHDLIMAVNDVANIAGTYGHFRSKWSPSALRPLQLQPTKFLRGPSIRHTVLQGRAEDLAPMISADLCYLDPPYKKRQYAANYHLIETIARGDDPEAIGVSGLRDWWDQYSDFCSKRKIGDAFAAILGKMDCPYYLVSYSEDGLITLDQLRLILKEFGRVRVDTIPYKRFRSNNGSPRGPINEYLIHVDARI